MHEMVSVPFLVGYPKWKVRCSTAAVSLSTVAKVSSTSETPEIYKKVTMAPEIILMHKLTWTCKQSK